MLNWWLKPPVNPIVKVYIFNYTNIDRFLDGTDAKIKVNEVGPYAYAEPVEKINLRFEKDFVTFNVSLRSLTYFYRQTCLQKKFIRINLHFGFLNVFLLCCSYSCRRIEVIFSMPRCLEWTQPKMILSTCQIFLLSARFQM